MPPDIKRAPPPHTEREPDSNPNERKGGCNYKDGSAAAIRAFYELLWTLVATKKLLLRLIGLIISRQLRSIYMLMTVTFRESPRVNPVGHEGSNESAEDGDNTRLNCRHGDRTSKH